MKLNVQMSIIDVSFSRRKCTVHLQLVSLQLLDNITKNDLLEIDSIRNFLTIIGKIFGHPK